jgi:hypothetical protein
MVTERVAGVEAFGVLSAGGEKGTAGAPRTRRID